MKIIDIVKRTNKYLAGEQLTYAKLLPFLDDAIDDINTHLNSTFPSFSDLNVTNSDMAVAEYNFFPDKYIRTVVTLGAAHYFYEMDEEGNTYDMSYADRYERNLFYMVRDYIEQVPEQYLDDETGSVVFSEDKWFLNNALNMPPAVAAVRSESDSTSPGIVIEELPYADGVYF